MCVVSSCTTRCICVWRPEVCITSFSTILRVFFETLSLTESGITVSVRLLGCPLNSFSAPYTGFIDAAMPGFDMCGRYLSSFPHSYQPTLYPLIHTLGQILFKRKKNSRCLPSKNAQNYKCVCPKPSVKNMTA